MPEAASDWLGAAGSEGAGLGGARASTPADSRVREELRRAKRSA